MSTLVTENLKRSSETASRSLRGVAAAWVNFDGTGTVATRDSQNVSSLTDHGTGDYSQSFSSAMADTFYSQTYGTYTQARFPNFGVRPPTVNGCSVLCGFASSLAGASTGQDASEVCGTFHGDLA